MITATVPKEAKEVPKEWSDRIDEIVNGNLILWNEVFATDPHFTKLVGYGTRKFTAIDAYYRILRATEMFGPVGKGWGWKIVENVPNPELVELEMEIWYKIDGEKCTYPVFGCAKRHYTKKENENETIVYDDEALKKAMTDGITKGLSYLGFSADVFFGLHDDSKYVEEQMLAHPDKERQDRIKKLRECFADADEDTIEKAFAWASKEQNKKVDSVDMMTDHQIDTTIKRLGEIENERRNKEN